MQNEQEQVEESVVESLVCPSFSTYSSNNLHDIADQVIRENDHLHCQNDDDENDFEFVAFQKAADRVFFDGRRDASHVFPIFNRDILTDDDGGRTSDAAAIRIPLGKFLIGDEESGSDSSPPALESSEEDDLEAVPAGTYCLWTPKSPQASPSKCKKSNSTGSSASSSSSSKRWKFLNLLRRSKSDGKESLVLLTPSSSPSLGPKKGAKGENSKEQCGGGSATNNIPKVAGKKIPAAKQKIPVSAHEALYGRKKETRRASYLPYKQDLVGFGVSFNAIGRGFPLHF